MRAEIGRLVRCFRESNWDPEKHPRAENGQFGNGSGGAGKDKRVSHYRAEMDKLRHAFEKAAARQAKDPKDREASYNAAMIQNRMQKVQKNLSSIQNQECDSTSSVGVPLGRAGVKGTVQSPLSSFAAKESARWARCFRSNESFRERGVVSVKKVVESARFIEKDTPAAGSSRFEIVLISEGLGNFNDAYFYPNNALKAAVDVFEGKKIYADHPTESEEEDLPERSVKDIIGHIENVRYRESRGQGELVGDAVVLPGESFAWARDMMRHTIEYSQKYPDKNFIGLSINAGGTSQSIDMDELARAEDISEAARRKVVAAREQGIRTAKLVNEIKSAISCDLVTQAGAGGRVLAEK